MKKQTIPYDMNDIECNVKSVELNKEIVKKSESVRIIYDTSFKTLYEKTNIINNKLKSYNFRIEVKRSDLVSLKL